MSEEKSEVPAEAEKPKVTVQIGGKSNLKPTLKMKVPPGGWNVNKHQQEKKAVGKTKNM